MSKTLPEINVSVTFRHTESTPALKSYATEKVTHCLRKYINNSADVQIVLSVQKRDHVVEVFESRDGVLDDGARIRPVAGIVGRLAAAGLRHRHVDDAAGIFQQLDRREAHIGAE